MTWAQVARKDFEDAVRSKMLWGIIAVFAGFMSFIMLVAVNTSDTSEATGDVALGLTASLSQLFVPIIALIAGYMAIVGERRSGSLRVLLGFPHSRRDVVLGKFVGRNAVIAVTIGAGSAASILVAALAIEMPGLGDAAGVLGSLVLLGVAFAGLAVGISAGARSRGKAMAMAIGSLLVFMLVWDAAAAAIYAVVTGSLPGLEAEAWYFMLKRLSPLEAFRAVTGNFIEAPLSSLFQLGIEEIPEGTTPEQLKLENRVAGTLPFYLRDWFAALTLAAWAVVPAVVGYLRFERLDL
jgi:ABC-2 type transport system permease protein